MIETTFLYKYINFRCTIFVFFSEIEESLSHFVNLSVSQIKVFTFVSIYIGFLFLRHFVINLIRRECCHNMILVFKTNKRQIRFNAIYVSEEHKSLSWILTNKCYSAMVIIINVKQIAS